MFNKNQYITEDELLDLLPGYVMGILEPDELRLVLKQIRSFPHVAEQVAALEESIAALAFTAPMVTSPLDAKSHILAKANAALSSASQMPVDPKSHMQPKSTQSQPLFSYMVPDRMCQPSV